MRFSLVIIAGLLALTIGLIAVPEVAPPGPQPSIANPPPASDVLEQAAAGETMAQESMARERIAIGTRWFAGRCLAWGTRRPLAGCQVRSGARATISDESGRFALRAPDGVQELLVTITAAHRIGVSRQVRLQAGANEIPDVALRAAGKISGLLADERGQPCAGCKVVVVPAQHVARQDGWQEQLQTESLTRADGSFAFGLPIAAGALQVRVPEVPSLLGDANHVVRFGEELFLSLQCRSWHAGSEVVGIVCDERGEPIVGAMLQEVAAPAMASPVLQAVYSDSEGRFRLVRKEGSVESFWLHVTMVDGSFESTTSGPHVWGQSGLRIPLSRRQGIWLHVVDAVDGAAIEHFAVQQVSTGRVRSAFGGVRSHAGHHLNGKCFLDGVGTGPHEIIVWPMDDAWLPNLPHAFTVSQSCRDLHIALVRASDLPVTVVTASGRPVADAALQLILPAQNQVVRSHEQLLQHGGSRAHPSVLLASARTDARGVASMRWADGDGPLQLRIEGSGIAPHVETGVRLTSQGLTIHVPDAGVLEASLDGAGGLRLELVNQQREAHLPPAWSAPLNLDLEGNIRADVPVGSWQLLLAVPMSNGRWRTLPEVIARVDIEAGRTSQVRQPVSAYLADSELSGRLFVDGRPARHVAVLHGVADGNGKVRAVDETHHAVGDRGGFRISNLLPGYYAVELRMTCSGQQVTVGVQKWRLLSRGKPVDCGTISVATAALTIALAEVGGKAVTQGMLVIRGDHGAAMTGSPDARGHVSFERVPVDTYEVQLRRGGKAYPLGRVDLTGDAAEPHRLIVR